MRIGGDGFDPRGLATPNHELLPARSPPVTMRIGGGGFDPRGLVTPIVLVLLVTSGAAAWIFNGLFVLLFVVPLVVGPLLSWYISSNLVDGSCPECAAPVQGFKGQRTVCMNCGASMSSDVTASGVFTREGAAATTPGVIEVDAVVDVDARSD